MSYIEGVDLARAIARLSRETDSDTAEDLLAACERGFVKAVNERDDDDAEQPDP